VPVRNFNSAFFARSFAAAREIEFKPLKLRRFEQVIYGAAAADIYFIRHFEYPLFTIFIVLFEILSKLFEFEVEIQIDMLYNIQQNNKFFNI